MVMKPAILVDPKPMKFNMDLAFQELLHNHLKAASIATVVDDQLTRFRCLKQALLMVNAGLALDKQEKLKEQQDEIKKQATIFRMLINNAGLMFNEDTGDYMFHPKVATEARVYTKTFFQLRWWLDENQDNWEKDIRTAMAKLGLMLLKDKTGADAAGSI